MTELKHACYCVYAIGETFRFRIKTELLSDGTACPAALLRLGVPAQRFKNIRFIDITALRITTHFLDERVTHTVATLVMSEYVNTDIYSGNPETTKRLGRKINNITGIGISYRKYYDTSTPE